MRVPVELTVLGELDGNRIAMCSENINLEGMFLFSREFIRPRAVFSARIWLTNEEEPIQAYLTACFIERTWTGYGVGVYISGISAGDSARWETFYRACATSRSGQLRQLVQAERTVHNRRIVVIGGAVSPLGMQAMRKQGLDVVSAPSVNEAVERVGREPVDAIISDMRRPDIDGLALCCQVNERRLPTRTVLLTDSPGPRDFLLGLYAGATRVIAKPCSNDMLVTRILEVLQQRLPGGRVAPADPDGVETTLEGPNPLAGHDLEPRADRPVNAMNRVKGRASGHLGQVYRYVSDRFSRRPSA